MKLADRLLKGLKFLFSRNRLVTREDDEPVFETLDIARD